MTADVVPFTGITRLDIPPEKILQKAIEAGLLEVVIIGYDADGDEYFASSQGSNADVLWHLERAKHSLMRMTDDLVEGE